MFVSTRARFLEDDYTMSNRTRNEDILRALNKTRHNNIKTMNLIPTIPISNTPMSHCCEKVLMQPG